MVIQTTSTLKGTLHETALALLIKDGRTLLEIHSASGISLYWLIKFKAGRIQHPSVNTVQKLYEFLSHKPLAV